MRAVPCRTVPYRRLAVSYTRKLMHTVRGRAYRGSLLTAFRCTDTYRRNYSYDTCASPLDARCQLQLALLSPFRPKQSSEHGSKQESKQESKQASAAADASAREHRGAPRRHLDATHGGGKGNIAVTEGGKNGIH